jgi:hypothetical protein
LLTPFVETFLLASLDCENAGLALDKEFELALDEVDRVPKFIKELGI